MRIPWHPPGDATSSSRSEWRVAADPPERSSSSGGGAPEGGLGYPGTMKVSIAIAGILTLYATPNAGARSMLDSRADGIQWSSSWEQALVLAKREGKPLFCALNMDGEKANDELAGVGYHDETIVKLSRQTVNLIGSSFEHAPLGQPCPRFGLPGCELHIAVEAALRKQVLQVSGATPIVAPQHLFLSSEGKLLLSVPYALSLPELQWCFAAALQPQGVERDVKLSSKLRPPKRLVMDRVPVLPAVEAARLLNREEALASLDQLKRGVLKGGERRKALRALMQTEEAETLAFMEALLREGPGRRQKKDPRLEYLAEIGALSPASYAPLLTEFLSAGEEALRNQTIVALEQLGSEDSLKALRKALGKERNPTLIKNLLRAVASAGPGDARVQKDLLRRAQKERAELLRINAIVALGYLSPSAEVSALLRELITSEEPKLRLAAACAMALTRNPEWEEVLTQLSRETQEEPQRQALKAIQRVFEAGDLRPLGKVLKRLAGDELERPRLFGNAP